MSLSTESSKIGLGTIEVSVSGGEAKSFPSGVTARDVLRECGLAVPEVFAVLVNGVPMDLVSTLAENVSLEPISFSSTDGKEIYRHSSTILWPKPSKICFPLPM